MPTLIRSCRRREVGWWVLTDTVVCGSVFVAWSRPRSHGGCIFIVVVVSPPDTIVSGHSGRVVLLANHRYDNSSAHLCSSSGCRSVVLRWPFVTVLAYVCRRHSLANVRLHCRSVHTVCITSSSTGSRSHCKNWPVY